MFEVSNFGPTRQLTMARSFFGKAFYQCHAYLLDGLLIDTGCPCIFRAFQQFLDNESVQRAALTHYHEDHAGNVISLNLTGIPVLAPNMTVPLIAKGVVNRMGHRQPYGLLFWGRSLGGETEPLPAMIETEHHRLEVIPAPGHSEDMVLFYERKEGWLFSGDLFIAARKTYWRQEEDPLTTIDSLEKTLRLDFDSLFCGHAPQLTAGKEALRQKLEFLREIQGQAWGLHQQGVGIGKITKKLLGGEGVWTGLTLGDFSRRRLIEGLLQRAPT